MQRPGGVARCEDANTISTGQDEMAKTVICTYQTILLPLRGRAEEYRGRNALLYETPQNDRVH